MSTYLEGFVPAILPNSMVVCGKQADSHIAHFAMVKKRAKHLAESIRDGRACLHSITDELSTHFEEITNTNERWEELAGMSCKAANITTDNLRFRQNESMIKLREALAEILAFLADLLVTVGGFKGAPSNEVYAEYLVRKKKQSDRTSKMLKHDQSKRAIALFTSLQTA